MTTATRKTFEQAFVDAIIPDMTYEQSSKIRQLYWHGQRIPLAKAVELFAKLTGGYNEFTPDMLAKLQAEFPHAGIEVTPAREGSVAIYLHIPTCTATNLKYMVRQFVIRHFNADEVDVVHEFSCLQQGETELVGDALRVWWD